MTPENIIEITGEDCGKCPFIGDTIACAYRYFFDSHKIGGESIWSYRRCFDCVKQFPDGLRIKVEALLKEVVPITKFSFYPSLGPLTANRLKILCAKLKEIERDPDVK